MMVADRDGTSPSAKAGQFPVNGRDRLAGQPNPGQEFPGKT